MSDKPLTLRYADIENKQDFDKIYKAVGLAARASHVPTPKRWRIREEIEDQRSDPILISRGARVIGAALISPFPDDPYLYDFALYRPYQGKGYGKEAL